MVGVPDGDRLVLVASIYGQQRNPGWGFNATGTDSDVITTFTVSLTSSPSLVFGPDPTAIVGL